jgi:hypothetical protein
VYIRNAQLNHLDIAHTQRYLPLFSEETDDIAVEPGTTLPQRYQGALAALWADKTIKKVVARSSEAAIPERYGSVSLTVMSVN